MANNVAAVLNDQIRRMSRREVRQGMKVVRKLQARHRRDLAALKRQLRAMAREFAYFRRQDRRRTDANAATASVLEQTDKLRFRAGGLKTHRAKLGISAADYGKLVGVSGLTIYHWESKKAKPRRAQLAKLAGVRGLGKREAVRRLELVNGRPAGRRGGRARN